MRAVCMVYRTHILHIHIECIYSGLLLGLREKNASENERAKIYDSY